MGAQVDQQSIVLSVFVQHEMVIFVPKGQAKNKGMTRVATSRLSHEPATLWQPMNGPRGRCDLPVLGNSRRGGMLPKWGRNHMNER